MRPSHVPDESSITRWAQSVFDKSHRGELTVRLVSESESCALNKQYRGLNKSTNVLSFPADWASDDGGEYFGDLAICADVVARESRDQGKSTTAHWAHMVVHGVLHLLGYDHQSNDEAVEMESREIGLLAGLGFDNPYEQEHSH
ncbi:MAG: rRNA maturation RNase YbeY [Pseudomonadota bacterium]